MAYPVTVDGKQYKQQVFSIQGETGSVQLSLSAAVAKYAVMYAICAQKDQYGNLQNYICDIDNNAKLEEGTDIPPEYHLLPNIQTQHANVEYGKIATVTFTKVSKMVSMSRSSLVFRSAVKHRNTREDIVFDFEL